MQIISTEVSPSSKPGDMTQVEFRGDGGERIVVSMKSSDQDLGTEDTLSKAQVMLLQAANFGAKVEGETGTPDSPTDAVESLRQEQSEREKQPSDLEEGLEDTFPASDPVSSTHTSTTATDRAH